MIHSISQQLSSSRNLDWTNNRWKKSTSSTNTSSITSFEQESFASLNPNINIKEHGKDHCKYSCSGHEREREGARKGDDSNEQQEEEEEEEDYDIDYLVKSMITVDKYNCKNYKRHTYNPKNTILKKQNSECNKMNINREKILHDRWKPLYVNNCVAFCSGWSCLALCLPTF